MTTILNSLIPVPAEVTYDGGASNVALKAYVLSGGVWTLEAMVAAVQVGGNYTWMAVYTPLTGNPYLFELMAYTDDTYATPNENYAASSRSVVLDPSVLQSVAGQGIMAIVNDPDLVVVE